MTGFLRLRRTQWTRSGLRTNEDTDTLAKPSRFTSGLVTVFLHGGPVTRSHYRAKGVRAPYARPKKGITFILPAAAEPSRQYPGPIGRIELVRIPFLAPITFNPDPPRVRSLIRSLTRVTIKSVTHSSLDGRTAVPSIRHYPTRRRRQRLMWCCGVGVNQPRQGDHDGLD